MAFSFASVEDLIVDTSLTYLSGEVLNTVQEGSRIDAKGGRFRYSVASESSLNWHVLTAGGVKLLYDPLDAATVDAEAFGLRADTGNDQIEFAQRAIDFAATQGGGTVIFPRGNILIDGTLHIGRPDTGLQAVKLQGSIGAYIGNTRLVHGASQTMNPLLNIAGARMVEIADIELRGNNVAPSSCTGENTINSTFEDWITPGCSAGRYNPYSAITFAALYGANPGPGQGYDFAGYNQAGLPSKVFLHRLRIQNFVAGVVIAPNAGTPGVEDIMIRDCSFVENTFGICSTGTQQRNCVVENCNIIGHYAITDGVTFGEQSGQPINIHNCNFGKSVNVMQAQTDVGQNMILSSYFENVCGIGLVGATASGAKHSSLIQGCNLSLIGQSTENTIFNKDVVTVVNTLTKLESCSLVAQTLSLWQVDDSACLRKV